MIEDDPEKLRELFNHSKKGVQYKTDQNFYFLWALHFKISIEELQKRKEKREKRKRREARKKRREGRKK